MCVCVCALRRLRIEVNLPAVWLWVAGGGLLLLLLCVCERESERLFHFSFLIPSRLFSSSASASASNKDEFRKPQWFEEAETDDELFDDDRKFAFQVFTSPLEMQRHFERQLQCLLESVQEGNEGKFQN